MLKQWHHPWGKTIVKLTLKTVCFLAIEYFLGAVGLDTLADYSEFIANHEEMMMMSQTSVTIVAAGIS